VGVARGVVGAVRLGLDDARDQRVAFAAAHDERPDQLARDAPGVAREEVAVQAHERGGARGSRGLHEERIPRGRRSRQVRGRAAGYDGPRMPVLLALLLQAAGAPTFAEDVAPILWQRCAGCHRPGEVGPFPLLEYTDAKKRAAQIVERVDAGAM